MRFNELESCAVSGWAVGGAAVSAVRTADSCTAQAAHPDGACGENGGVPKKNVDHTGEKVEE